MNTISVMVFAVGTMVVLIFTWQFSIKAKRPHGIPRFFSFESILLLALLNYSVWYKNPSAWYQIVSWIMLAVSIVFAFQGFLLLRILGKPQGDFENTSRLVVSGLFRYIRHPLYASLVWLGTGIFFKDVTNTTSLLAFINIVALVATAKIEEKEMLEKFGKEYATYIRKTKMFIPFVW